MTPNALRLLAHLGVLDELRARRAGAPCPAVEVFDLYSGAKVAESSFRGVDGRGIGEPAFGALRITRGECLEGVLAVVDKCENVSVQCGVKTERIAEDEDGVELFFEGRESRRFDVLIGCDGIHSVARRLHVEPERTEVYSGICNAFGFAARARGEAGGDGAEEWEEVPFETSGMHFSRRGMLLTSFYNEAKDSVYVGALMQVPELASRDGWKAAGADAEKTRKDMLERFAGAKNPVIGRWIKEAQDLYLWPVFTLTKGGKWATQRVMLIGDSAHAMPPQGEATGIVFEDGVLFSRCLARWTEKSRDKGIPVKEAFDAYERLRRTRIDTAFDESQMVVSTVQEVGWLKFKIKMNVVPWFLWWTGAERERRFTEDVTTCELNY